MSAQPADTAQGKTRAGLSVTGPELTGLALARGDVDRSAHLRSDEAWLAAARADLRQPGMAVGAAWPLPVRASATASPEELGFTSSAESA